jgi:hypothetical protein
LSATSVSWSVMANTRGCCERGPVNSSNLMQL